MPGSSSKTGKPSAAVVHHFSAAAELIQPHHLAEPAECMVSRAGDMVRATAPVEAVVYRDPLPPFHWSVCIRRNYQSEKEQKARTTLSLILT